MTLEITDTYKVTVYKVEDTGEKIAVAYKKIYESGRRSKL
jgi:hypothetical protein